MNIYEYYKRPRELNGYSSAWSFVPELALEYCKETGYPNDDLEEAIFTNPRITIEYVKTVLNRQRRYDIEEILLKAGPEWTCEYARDIMHKRWPQAEPAIMKDPTYAVLYANGVLHQRWPECEPYVLKDLTWAIRYSEYVIRGEWPELEEKIKDNPELWKKYISAMQHLKSIQNRNK